MNMGFETYELALALKDKRFVTREQAKCDKRLKCLLRKIDTTGWCGRKSIDTLWSNGLIQFGCPRPELAHPWCQWNCYRLTDKGHAALA